jgi:hypothetical protein
LNFVALTFCLKTWTVFLFNEALSFINYRLIWTNWFEDWTKITFVLCVKQFIGKCSLVEWTFQKFHEAFQVKFYIKSKLTKCKIIYLQCIFRKFIVV